MTFTHYMVQKMVTLRGCKEMYKSDCKDIINITKELFFQMESKNPEINASWFLQNIEQHNCFQHDNDKKCFSSRKPSY